MTAKETKKPYTFVIRPSVKKDAQDKASKKGDSLSQVIENLLVAYVKKYSK